MENIAKSRSFWVALVGLLVIVLSHLAPEFREQLEALSPILIEIIAILTGGFAVKALKL